MHGGKRTCDTNGRRLVKRQNAGPRFDWRKRPGSFYTILRYVLVPLGYKRVWSDGDAAGCGIDGKDEAFAIKKDAIGHVKQSVRFHIAFIAPNQRSVMDFHDVACSLGAISDGEPELHPLYGKEYFAAFIIDPDGHRIEAVTMDNLELRPARPDDRRIIELVYFGSQPLAIERLFGWRRDEAERWKFAESYRPGLHAIVSGVLHLRVGEDSVIFLSGGRRRRGVGRTCPHVHESVRRRRVPPWCGHATCRGQDRPPVQRNPVDRGAPRRQTRHEAGAIPKACDARDGKADRLRFSR